MGDVYEIPLPLTKTTFLVANTVSAYKTAQIRMIVFIGGVNSQ